MIIMMVMTRRRTRGGKEKSAEKPSQSGSVFGGYRRGFGPDRLD